MIYLNNGFSLSMLSSDRVEISVATWGVEDVKLLLRTREWRSAVGHADTARLFSKLLDFDVAFNRISLALDFGVDTLVVGQYFGPRLPEGVTTLPVGAEIVWKVVSASSVWVLPV